MEKKFFHGRRIRKKCRRGGWEWVCLVELIGDFLRSHSAGIMSRTGYWKAMRNIRDSAYICWGSVQLDWLKREDQTLFLSLFVCLLLCCFVFVFCSFWTSFFWDFFFRKISHAVTLTIISWEFWDFLGVATLRVCYESILFMKHLSVVKSVLLLSQIYSLLHMKLLL